MGARKEEGVRRNARIREGKGKGGMEAAIERFFKVGERGGALRWVAPRTAPASGSRLGGLLAPRYPANR